MDLSDLKPAPFNPREIDAPSLKGLGASIAEFGDLAGIVWNKRNGYLVAGHQRLKVLTAAGATMDDDAVVMPDGSQFHIRVVDWDDPTHKAAMVVANSPLVSGTYTGDLDAIIGDLKADDAWLDKIEPLRLEELLPEVPVEVVQDEVPEPPTEPVTQPGDLWTMGEHRVLCGDSTKVSTCETGTVDLVFTDPPYGVDYTGKTEEALKIASDGEQFSEVIAATFRRAVAACRPGAVWYVAAPAGPQFYSFATILLELDIWRQTLVWAKDTMVLGHSDYHYRHEVLFYGWKPGKHKPPPDRTQTTVWAFDRPKASREHPTMKPVSLVAKAIGNSTKPGDLILDPFLGSGTTLIAAHQLERRCYGIEIEPRYVDVICRRFLNLTGESPVRESDGAQFADLP